jgi:hypothetical protein
VLSKDVVINLKLAALWHALKLDGIGRLIHLGRGVHQRANETTGSFRLCFCVYDSNDLFTTMVGRNNGCADKNSRKHSRETSQKTA